ncbi:hypothetical protein AB0K15_13115 [Amycolatopsis sp. NPDC049253]
MRRIHETVAEAFDVPRDPETTRTTQIAVIGYNGAILVVRRL